MGAFGGELARRLVRVVRRVPAVVWVLLLAGLAFWLLTRGRYEYASAAISEKTRGRVQRVCRDGGAFEELYKSESSWSKFDKGELKQICRDAYNQRVQDSKDGKTVDASQCRDRCPSGLLAKTRPCMNKDKTKCCVTNGKDCVDAKTSKNKEKKTVENIRKRKSDERNLLNQTNGDAAKAAELKKKLDGETTTTGDPPPAPANAAANTPVSSGPGIAPVTDPQLAYDLTLATVTGAI